MYRSYYSEALEITPRPWWVIITAIAVIGTGVIIWYFPATFPVFGVFGGAAAIAALTELVPRYVHAQISMVITHLERRRAAQAITPESELTSLQLRLVDKQIEYARTIAQMDRNQLKALITLPTLAMIEESPWSGDWLLIPGGPISLAVSGEHEAQRVIKTHVYNFTDAWLAQIRAGKPMRTLPTINTWSDSKMRDSARILVAGLADAGLVDIADKENLRLWKGNLTAVLKPEYSLADCLKWLRVIDRYETEV